MSVNERTIQGREVAFPMRDPYGPVVNARIPVPGLTRWPGRQVLGRRYYGMDQAEGAPVVSSGDTPVSTRSFNSESQKLVNGGDDEACGFAGFADCADSGGPKGFGFVSGDPLTDPGYIPGILAQGNDGNDNSGGGIDWGSIISQGIKAAPAIIQAGTGGGTPYGYYGTTVSQAIPTGYTRNAQGQLIPIQSASQLAGGLGAGAATIANSLSNFVTQNPMLVLGGGVLLLFLFMKPPGRR